MYADRRIANKGDTLAQAYIYMYISATFHYDLFPLIKTINYQC